MGDNGGQITLRYPLHSEGLGRSIGLLKLIVFSSLRLETITAIRIGLFFDVVHHAQANTFYLIELFVEGLKQVHLLDFAVLTFLGKPTAKWFALSPMSLGGIVGRACKALV
jgi:hypothetical protein